MANEFIIRKGFKSQEDSQITGSISLSGSFKDQESSSGTAGQVLSSTVSGSQWVDVGGSGIGDVTKTGTIVANQIAIWNNTTNQLRSDPTFVIDSNYKITLYQPRVSGGSSNIDSYNIGGGNLANVTGGNNAGFGNNNLFNITTGQQNTAFGNQSLYNNTEGLLNTAIGHTALYSNTTGGNNIAIGNQALYSNTEGSNNIGIGVFSVLNNTTGIKNIGIGRNSLSSTTGDGNIAIGFEAGKNITTGDNNVIIGTNTGSTIATSNNNIIISDGSGNNRLQFGSTGAATFSNSITADQGIFNSTANTYADGSLILRDLNGANPMYLTSVVGNLAISNGGAADHLTISSTGLTQINSTNTTALELITNQSASSLRLKNTGSIVADWIMQSGGITAGDLSFYNLDTSAYRLTITSGGNVGIGTTLPDRNLSVVSTSDTSVEIKSGTANQSSLWFSDTDDGNIGGVLYTHNDNSMAFRVNDSTRLTISSGGDVILGPYKATPASTYNKFYYMKSAPYFWDCGNTYNPNYEIAAIAMGAPGPGQDDGEILFQTATNVCSNNASSVLTTRARIIETGEFEMYNGIKFPNGGNTTLDAYEEATWTPNVQSTAGGAYTISNARGKYIKVGKHVTVQFYFVVSAVNGGTGARITNLPFATKSGAAGDNYIGNSWNTSNGQLSSAVAAQNGTIAIIYVYSGGNPIGQGQGNTGTITYISQS